MSPLFKEYQKYKWFITSSGKTVVGGKNALQNDELLKQLASLPESSIVMHTSAPGSPFSTILSPINSITQQEMQECATFTACFSQAWKSGKSKSDVDIFESTQLSKEKNMKSGMWSVKGRVKTQTVPLKLVLTKQKGILRAVPEKTLTSSKEGLMTFVPGTIDKKDLFLHLKQQGTTYSQEEFLAALPAGGSRILP